MIGILAAILLATAQADQTPAALPVDPPRVDRATVDAQLRLALLADVLPRRHVTEFRPLAGLELTAAPSSWLTVRFDGEVEGLAADRRGATGAVRGEVREAWIELGGTRGDLRVGYGRVVWGRLDEIAPTDVVNPTDATRFFLEDRNEARLGVVFTRARVSLGERLSLEGVLAPVFRRGVFDRIDESSSPFNLVLDGAVPPGVQVDLSYREQDVPAITLQHMSGGGRLQATAGRVDVAVAAFRGFDALGPIELVAGPPAWPSPAVPARLVERHPRFTMVGADFETVAGAWAWRGEMAAFVERTLPAVSRPGLVDGRSLDAGIGFDRRAGSFRLFGSAIVHHEDSPDDPLVARTNVNIVGSIERTFGRERYRARLFTVVNPTDRASFVRGLLVWRVRDQLAVEVSAGTFTGTSDDTIGRFRGRDFFLAKLRSWF